MSYSVYSLKEFKLGLRVKPLRKMVELIVTDYPVNKELILIGKSNGNT